MDFEEMQVIWDSQNNRPMYALDLDAVHASVQRKGRRIERSVSATEIGMIAITAGLAVFLTVTPILKGAAYHKFFGAALLLLVSVWLLVGRLRRRRNDVGFEMSVRGDLNRALSQLDHHISLARKFQWWFLFPAFLIVLVDYAVSHESKSIWNLPVNILVFGAAYLVARMELRCVHLPKQRDLEALRTKLTNDG